jgi:nickel-dependent lactate racemase
MEMPIQKMEQNDRIRKNDGASYSLPWGKERLPIDLPAGWEVKGYLEPAPIPGVQDAESEIIKSLTHPIGAPGLSSIYHPGMKVALLVDDSSRPTPIELLLPPVLAELERAGLVKDDLTLIPALGVHRAMTESEIAARIGRPSMAGLKWENPDCDDRERMINLGTTQRGTPVWINRTTAQADVIIALGCIKPHIIASFGGGYKSLVPGVAARETIAHNHALNCRPETYNMVGQPIERNPMRLDLEEAGKMVTGKVFIVNVVLNNALQIVRVVAGDPILAHREGAGFCASLYGVPIQDQADVVIVGSFPMDQDFRQGVTALANCTRAVRKGGVIITVVRADEGVGVFGLANQKLPVGQKGLKLLAPLLVRLVPRIKMRGLGEEDRFFLYFALQSMRLAGLRMVAPTIPPEVKGNLPFVTFDEDLDSAIQQARRRFPGDASVLIFPHGGTTYPALKQGFSRAAAA